MAGGEARCGRQAAFRQLGYTGLHIRATPSRRRPCPGRAPPVQAGPAGWRRHTAPAVGGGSAALAALHLPASLLCNSSPQPMGERAAAPDVDKGSVGVDCMLRYRRQPDPTGSIRPTQAQARAGPACGNAAAGAGLGTDPLSCEITISLGQGQSRPGPGLAKTDRSRLSRPERAWSHPILGRLKAPNPSDEGSHATLAGWSHVSLAPLGQPASGR